MTNRKVVVGQWYSINNFCVRVLRLMRRMLVLMVCICAVVSSPTSFANSAQDESAFANTKICKKAVKPLAQGKRHGTLKSTRTIHLYAGPSLICGIDQEAPPKTTVIVLGQAKSTFGKVWYNIGLSDQSKTLWVPAKRVVLGDVVKPEIAHHSITSAVMQATLSLNARSCPEIRCQVVGNLRKDTSYKVTRKADNGWYLVTLDEQKQGWANGKYLLPAAQQPTISNDAVATQHETSSQVTSTARQVGQEKVIEWPSRKKREQALMANTSPALKTLAPKSIAPKIDPCVFKTNYTRAKHYHMGYIKQGTRIQKVPHTQCELHHEFEHRKAMLHLGETELYDVFAMPVDGQIQRGYVLKDGSGKRPYRLISLFTPKQGEDMFGADMFNDLSKQETYWNSVTFKVKDFWQDTKYQVRYWYHYNTAQAIYATAFVLGLLTLIWSVSRQKMLRLDQLLLRTGYFALRSRPFWRMLRRLAVILIVAACVMFVIYLYVMWLYEVANRRQMIMGMGSLGLMSLSIGWFGARLASFFSGFILFWLSVFEFMLFVLSVCLVFLAPSLLLLAFYYGHYRRHAGDTATPSAPFDRNEIERIHEQVFKLRNFYPETLIRWSRQGGFKARVAQAMQLVRAKSNPFDRFFDHVNGQATA